MPNPRPLLPFDPDCSAKGAKLPINDGGQPSKRTMGTARRAPTTTLTDEKEDENDKDKLGMGRRAHPPKKRYVFIFLNMLHFSNY